MASQGQYSRILDEAIRKYITKDGNLTRTGLRGIKDTRLRSIIEKSNPLSLVFKGYYKFDNRNPISDVFDARLRGVNPRLAKIEQEKRLQRENFEKLISVEKEKLRKKKSISEELSDDDDDDDDNSGSKIPTFKISIDGTIKRLAEDEFNLNNFWNEFKEPEDRQERVEETKPRMEAGVVVNDVFKDIESIVNKDKVGEDYIGRRGAIEAPFNKLRGNLPQIQINDEKTEEPDDSGWYHFRGGYWDPHHSELMFEIQKRGLDGEVNYKLIDNLGSRHCANVMEANQITIHIDSGNIIVENNDTNKSIHDFLNLQMDESKKRIYSVLRYAGSLEDYKYQFIHSIVEN